MKLPIGSRCWTGLAALLVSLSFSGVARSEDPAEASRESIIQGVRDDVRRQIKSRAAREADGKSTTATASNATRSSGTKKPKPKTGN